MKCMVKENLPGQIKVDFKELIKMEKKMGKVGFFGQMVINFRVSGKTENKLKIYNLLEIILN